jgi:hypothetical protein
LERHLRGETGGTCLDSHPSLAGVGASSYDPNDDIIEPGLRHAFRLSDDEGITELFLTMLGLPGINFQQTGTSPSVAPADSNPTQVAVYRALANSPFCNIRRPEDDYPPVSRSGSMIPEMFDVGVPASAAPGLGLVPFNPALGSNIRPPPGLTGAERYSSLPCDPTLPFAFGPAPIRPTGDPVRCPNGDVHRTASACFPFVRMRASPAVWRLTV